LDTEAFDTNHKESEISWKTKKLPAVLTAQSSTGVKAVVKEQTKQSHVSNKNNKRPCLSLALPL
jgi:hypothetical protein